MPAAMPFDRATRRFADLERRRHDYYLELLRSGRWVRYFSEPEFAARLRDVINATTAWDELAVPEPPAQSAQDSRSAA